MFEEGKLGKKGYQEGEAATPDVGPEIAPLEVDPHEDHTEIYSYRHRRWRRRGNPKPLGDPCG